jgi:hypothetical protein
VQISPRWDIDFMNPRPTSPAQPQNLLRATLQNGPNAMARRLGSVAGMLGQINEEEIIDPLPQHTGPVNVAVQNANGGTRAAWKSFYGIAAPVSAAASAYHGYRRNDSVGWAVWWALMGGLFPLVTPAIGVAQGWGERRRGY